MEPTEKDRCEICGITAVRVWNTTAGNKCETCRKVTGTEYVYGYPMPSITATCVVICAGHFAVITRRDEPFKGCLALPGGFMNLDETNVAACVREAREEIGIILDEKDLQLVCVNDAPNRDPRGRIVDFAYSVIIPLATSQDFKAGDDAESAAWLPIEEFEDPERRPIFAFDHEQVILKALEQRRNKVK